MKSELQALVPVEGLGHWYRINDDWDRWRSGATPTVEKVPVLKYTKCGAWVETCLGRRRFVNRTTTKRWACPTIKEAVESFEARKKSLESRLKRRLQECQEQLAAIRDPEIVEGIKKQVEKPIRTVFRRIP